MNHSCVVTHKVFYSDECFYPLIIALFVQTGDFGLPCGLVLVVFSSVLGFHLVAVSVLAKGSKVFVITDPRVDLTLVLWLKHCGILNRYLPLQSAHNFLF